MAGSNYTNFELDLSKKILNLLKVGITVLHLHMYTVNAEQRQMSKKMRCSHMKPTDNVNFSFIVNNTTYIKRRQCEFSAIVENDSLLSRARLIH